MYVCTLLSFFLSLSLPLRFPLFLLFFSPLLFHLIHRAGNSNGMESFQAGRSGISSLLRCAMRDPASFNNGDALPIPLCRMKKSSADGSIASRNIFLSSTILRNFISASAGYPCRCLNANARCQKAAGARSRRRSYLN